MASLPLALAERSSVMGGATAAWVGRRQRVELPRFDWRGRRIPPVGMVGASGSRTAIQMHSDSRARAADVGYRESARDQSATHRGK